ncbi:MFS transporter [Novosphingobium rosa]|uniref:MFS transporter n=1 Tax=Novosphingobium rosa TaxID=76978 RepID=UPI000B2298FA|nr:MFS transporter [Novosphingobium rosa]
MQTGISERARMLMLFTIVLTMFMEMLNASLMNVAIPSIKADFHADALSVRWLISGYAFGFGMTLLLAGNLADTWGHRLIYLLGMAIFTTCSAWSMLAPGIVSLIAARMGQGIGNAMVAPQMLAFMQILFSPVERVRKLPYLGVSAAMGTMLGPVLGGGLISPDAGGLGWRAVFAMDLAGGLAALLCGLAFLPKGTAQGRRPASVIGTLLLSGAAACLMMAFMCWGRESRFNYPVGFMALAVMLGLACRQWLAADRTREAIFSPELTGYSNLLTGALMTVGLAAGHGSFLVIFNFAMQHGRGHSAFHAGLMYLPFGCGVLIGLILLGRRFLVQHGRRVLALGALLMAFGASCVMAVLGSSDMPLLWAIPGCVVAGIGGGMSSGCLGPVAVAWVHVQHAGMASALLRLGQQMGMVLGSVLIVQPYFADSGSWGYPKELMAIFGLQALLVVVALLALRLNTPLFPMARPVPAVEGAIAA